MRNSFSLYRVGLLMKRQWVSFGKIFLIALGSMALIILGIYLYNLPDKENITGFLTDTKGEILITFRIAIFCIVGILFVSLSSSWYFSKWGKKAIAIEELLLPSTNIEKLVSGILLTSVLCIGSYLIIFIFIDSGYRMYFNDFLKTLNSKITTQADSDDYRTMSLNQCHVSFFTKSINTEYFLFVILIGILIQSIFLLGSIYFKAFQYIKTLIALAITVFIVVFSFEKLAHYLDKGRVHVYHTLDELDHKMGSIPMFFYIIIPIVTMIFYWITYLRIKEKEV